MIWFSTAGMLPAPLEIAVARLAGPFEIAVGTQALRIRFHGVGLVAAVVGIEVSVTEVVGKWKVSQNRSISDRAGVAEALEREATPSGAALAALMRETLDGGD